MALGTGDLSEHLERHKARRRMRGKEKKQLMVGLRANYKTHTVYMQLILGVFNLNHTGFQLSLDCSSSSV